MKYIDKLIEKVPDWVVMLVLSLSVIYCVYLIIDGGTL